MEMQKWVKNNYGGRTIELADRWILGMGVKEELRITSRFRA